MRHLAGNEPIESVTGMGLSTTDTLPGGDKICEEDLISPGDPIRSLSLRLEIHDWELALYLAGLKKKYKY